MGKLEKTAVSLRITGQSLQPDEITSLLGCQPTRAAKTGDTISHPNGRTRLIKTGFWHLRSEIDANELDKKIEGLLAQLTDDLEVWDHIARTCRLELFCGLFMGAWNEGFSLSAELITKLGQRHIELGCDIYGPVDSWEALSERE
jgi:hypothetical protein